MTADASPAGGPTPDNGRIDEVITAYPSARTGALGSIHGVGLTVLVSQLKRSVAFYRDVLGFAEIDGSEDSAVLASGDTRLVLLAVAGEAPVDRRPVRLNLEVGDLDQAFRDLTGKGITFTGRPAPVNRGGKLELWEAMFRDPDGNDIALTQWRAVN